ESAKGTGRPQFAEMRKYLGINRSVKTILCEKTDRLYRNFSDYVDLDVDQGDLTVVLVKENTILNKESRSHEKLVHGFKVLLAKNYIDNLREETAKGMLEKAEQGEFPDRAPLGYKNNKETRRIDVVPEQAPLVRRMFELYAAGQLSITNCWEKMTEEGLRTRAGRKIARSQIAFMLANPIYHGEFRFRGKMYKGVHQPIISKGLFETVQKVLKRWDKPRKTPREYAFRGFLTCGKCGCSFTAQTKKKKYIYYNCTQGRGKCLNAWVREDRLDAKIGELLKQFQMSPEDFETAKRGLLESHAGEKEYHDQAVAALHQDYRRLQAKLDTAYNDKLEGKITAEFWEKQAATWRKEQEENRAAVARHENANKSYFELGVAILELATNAYENYRVRSLSEKRRLASALLSNLTVTGENVVPIYKEPFGLLAEGLARPNWLPLSDSNPAPPPVRSRGFVPPTPKAQRRAWPRRDSRSSWSRAPAISRAEKR
ncbi:MAG: recombinase family protein, partial [Elusimicrobia bacterium]|nr:recombinase family protein [Elusimicrobiota bacterium]